MKIADEKELEEKILSVDIKKEIWDAPTTIIKYIKDTDEIYLKVLFFLFCYDSLDRIDVEHMAKYVSNEINVQKITEILNFWRNEKILDYSFKHTDNTNKIGGEIDTSAELDAKNIIELRKIAEKSKKQTAVQPIDKLSEALETKDEFRRLTHEAQVKFNKIFNPIELNVMLNLYEINQVDGNLLRKLVDVCVIEKKPNVAYLEKIALGLSANGILTVGDYEKNYSEFFKTKELEAKILRIFKMEPDHKYSSKEKNYIRKWAMEFDFVDEIIEEGYNICIKNLHELSFGYINGIFSNWNAKGFTTLEDIKTEFNKSRGFHTTDSKASSFNIDQFFEKAVQKAMMSID